MINLKTIQIVNFFVLFCNAINSKRQNIKLHQNASPFQINAINQQNFDNPNIPEYMEYKEDKPKPNLEELELKSEINKTKEKIQNIKRDEGKKRIDHLMAELQELDNVDRNTGLVGNSGKTDSENHTKTQLDNINSDQVKTQNAAFKLRDYHVINSLNADKPRENRHRDVQGAVLEMIGKLVSRVRFLFKAYRNQKVSNALSESKVGPFDELQKMYEVFHVTNTDKVMDFKQENDQKINEYNSNKIHSDDIIAQLEDKKTDNATESEKQTKDLNKATAFGQKKAFVSMAAKYEKIVKTDQKEVLDSKDPINIDQSSDKQNGMSHAKLLKFLIEVDLHTSALVKQLGLKPKPIFLSNKRKFRKLDNFEKSKRQ